MSKFNPIRWLQIVATVVAGLSLAAQAQAEPVLPAAKNIKGGETAILLVDFQANFVAPDGAWYGKFAEHYAKTRMLERTVELVGKARAKGVLVVHITEGYTSDYRELDPANPGDRSGDDDLPRLHDVAALQQAGRVRRPSLRCGA